MSLVTPCDHPCTVCGLTRSEHGIHLLHRFVGALTTTARY